MAARLRQHALARVDQHHGEVGVRRAGRHVAGVLLVAGRVGDDEFALVGREEAIGDVDGDALLALGLQPVDQQREVDVVAVGAELLGILFQRRELILEQHLGIVKQAADQRGLAVIDAAAGEEAQERLVFLLGEEGFEIEVGRSLSQPRHRSPREAGERSGERACCERARWIGPPHRSPCSPRQARREELVRRAFAIRNSPRSSSSPSRRSRRGR